jgi:hypothetical protein
MCNLCAEEELSPMYRNAQAFRRLAGLEEANSGVWPISAGAPGAPKAHKVIARPNGPGTREEIVSSERAKERGALHPIPGCALSELGKRAFTRPVGPGYYLVRLWRIGQPQTLTFLREC